MDDISPVYRDLRLEEELSRGTAGFSPNPKSEDHFRPNKDHNPALPDTEFEGRLRPNQGANPGDGHLRATRIFLSDKERDEAVKKAGDALTIFARGDLPRAKADLERLKLSTKEIDALIKDKDASADAAKPLQAALLKGDMQAVQKFLSEAKPEQLESAVKLIQEHANKAGSSLHIDIHEGNKLIVSEIGSDRAVVISGGKPDVIGVNTDGSYDFKKQYRGEDAGKELKSLTDTVLRCWGSGMQNPREFPRPRPDELPFMNFIQVSPLDELIGKSGGIRIDRK
jgi:hypothetical protein